MDTVKGRARMLFLLYEDNFMTDDDNLDILKNSELLKGLKDDEIQQIYEFVMPSERFYYKNQIIINQGEPVSKIGIVKIGTVISMKYHFNGDAQILRIYKRGEVLSLDAVNTTFLTSPVALLSQSDCSILFIPYRKIFEVKELSFAARERVLFNNSEILSNELVRFMYKIDVLSKRTLQDRVLTYLSIIREKKGKDSFDISMNQEEFAQYLCVNRSVLSKELNRMRSERQMDYTKNRYTLLHEHMGEGKKARE
ncbi:MAG: Crp/Fnr family transcriptional regulator, partial [Clostridia bacterium]|nr:Crp/Fnr family transcriptional regulator [Clostridia bacterium]